MYSIEHAVSIWVCIRSIGVGFLIGTLYDIFRIFRFFISRSKYSVFVQDIVFFCIAAAVTFVFLLESDYGIIRGYILIGELAGFFLYILTIGRVLFRVCAIVSARIKKLSAGAGLALKRFNRKNGKNKDHADSNMNENSEVRTTHRMKFRGLKKRKNKGNK